MPAQFHPPAEMLIDYASGALREAPSLVVATHLALCPDCRHVVTRCEAIGGRLLDRAEAIAVSEACRNRVMAAINSQIRQPEQPAPSSPDLCHILPAPLRGYVGCGVSKVAWSRLTRQIDFFELSAMRHGQMRGRLVRLQPGTQVPAHRHKGNEYTLVLAGSFRDNGQLYRRGDFLLGDGSTAHAPVVGEAEACICLMVSDAPLIPTALLPRLLNLFVRI